MKYYLLPLFTFILSIFTCAPLFAQTDLSVRGSGRLFPVAIPAICVDGLGADEPATVPLTVEKNLGVSGLFEVLDRGSFIESAGKCEPGSFSYSDWSIIGAEGLVKGTIVSEGGRNITARLYLHDVQQNRVVLGKEYKGTVQDLRSIAHRFSNEILKYFTGDYGVFGTQVVFSGKVGRFKELFSIDMEGSNLRQLTNEKGLAISSSWSPTGDSLLYTSYRSRVPDLFSYNIQSGRTKQITKSVSMELGGKYSSDGSSIALSRTNQGASQLVLLNRDGSDLKTLTPRDGSIYVSPTWSPDNRYMAFCSNRAGSPQIYTINTSTKAMKRISYARSSYCTSPSWSPKGDKIAYVCRADSGFQIFVSRPDGSGASQLTSVGNNEDPSWAPDGKQLVYSSTFGRGRTFQLAVIDVETGVVRQLTEGRSDSTQPAWVPLSL